MDACCIDPRHLDVSITLFAPLLNAAAPVLAEVLDHWLRQYLGRVHAPEDPRAAQR